jgi:hypothetical protein
VPLLHSKHPRQNERKAIGSLGHGGGGSGGGVDRERWGGRLGTDPRSVRGLGWGRGTAGEGAQRHSQAVATGSSAPARRRLGEKSERVGELQQMPEEVGDALVGQCGRPDLVLAAAASDGGARAGHKELGRLGMRGKGRRPLNSRHARLLAPGGPTAASTGARGRTNGGGTGGP